MLFGNMPQELGLRSQHPTISAGHALGFAPQQGVAVILNETNALVVDESWLKGESAESSQKQGLSAFADREVEMSEAALAETGGRISGPTGAAAKLGIPRQTLESKIRRLRINKYRHKRSAS